MTKTLLIKWFDGAVWGLSVFLIFCALFEPYMSLPGLVAWMGGWHPLILHFPIVLLLWVAVMGLLRKDVPVGLLRIAVFSALITAISGFFLGKESPERGSILVWHQWLGITLALIAVGWYAFLQLHGKGVWIRRLLLTAMLILVAVTGHYGGMLTHGRDFLALPTSKQRKIPANPIVYTHIVHAIFEDHCISCHNTDKRKGELSMLSMTELLKGGEDGPAFIPGNPGESEMLKRIHLPLSDEGHMPPEGKKPLDPDAVAILERWIALGASDTLKLDDIPADEPLVGLVRRWMGGVPEEKWKDLPEISDSELVSLASDYITINRISDGSQALAINAYLPPVYDAQAILRLAPLAPNIVRLDLSGLPIGAPEMDLISQCVHLEWLEIDDTPVTDSELSKLAGLQHLNLIKMYGTPIGDKGLQVLGGISALRKLYAWDTSIGPDALDAFQRQRPEVVIDLGFGPEATKEFLSVDSLNVE